MSAERTITLAVTRYSPEEDAQPRVQSYTIPYREDMVVLDALNYIKSYVDGSLTFRWSCRMGICGSCGMTVNGTPTLTCAAFLHSYYPREVYVEPLANFPVVRDLVIDMSDFMRKLSAVKPWIIREQEKSLAEGTYLQTPAQREDYEQYSACINCMLCYAACPVYAMEPEFLGPAAIALGRRYNLDSRDQGAAARLPVLASSSGIWDCTFVGECSVVCPKNVDPARAIQQTKVATTMNWYKKLLLPWGQR
jgi:fumarate reductase iron-sulfur subunit